MKYLFGALVVFQAALAVWYVCQKQMDNAQWCAITAICMLIAGNESYRSQELRDMDNRKQDRKKNE